MSKITYTDKAPFQTNENIPIENKCTADDMNEIKEVVNTNADELENKQPKEEGKGLSTNDFTNEYKQKLDALTNYDDTEIKQEITNIKEEQTNQNEKIQQNSDNITEQNKNIEELKQENEKLKNNLINVTTDLSSNINIQDCSDFEGIIDLEGNSVQEGEPTPENPVTIQNVEGNIDITVCNKNTFNSKKIPNGSIITVNDDQSITLKNNTNASGYVNTGIKLKDICKGLKSGNTTFLKIITTFENKYIYLAGINQLWNDETSKVLTEEILESTVVLYGGYQKTDTIQIQISLNKLEEYTQHQSQTITFPLSEEQKLMKGDYLADDGIHHKKTQIVLDGTEDWSLTTRDDYYAFWLTYDKVGMVNKPNFKICSHFPYTNTVFNNAPMNTLCENSSAAMIIFKVDFCTTVAEWKAYLAQQKEAGTPIILEYELAEEVIEPYTEEQQEAYNKLQKVLPYKLVTNIFTDLALLKFNYIADTKTYIDNKFNNLAQQFLNL